MHRTEWYSYFLLHSSAVELCTDRGVNSMINYEEKTFITDKNGEEMNDGNYKKEPSLGLMVNYCRINENA